jgi:hypothetical protein
MKIIIKLANDKSQRRIDLSSFEKNARRIFTKDVRTQINRAKTIQNSSSVVKCNNPV